MLKTNNLKGAVLFLFLVTKIFSKCSFEVGPDNKPFKVDKEPFLIEGLT